MAKIISISERPMLTDFATIFAHMWYRDFLLQPSLRDDAQRADWTTHIGIAVRSTADLMGLFTYFESGGRTDAVLRDNQRDPVAALEWEWSALHRPIVTEFDKLKMGCAAQAFAGLQFACLIGYARGGNSVKDRFHYTSLLATTLDRYKREWSAELPPLLLIIIHFERKGKGREFTKITIEKISGGNSRLLREQPAYPWNLKGSRWAQPVMPT